MLSEDTHKPLRDDVRLLGTLLGETLIRQEGDEFYQRVERVRACAKRARRSADEGSGDALRGLADELASMPLEAAVPVARAFSQFLHLANVAEQYHRIRSPDRSRPRSKRRCRAWRRRFRPTASARRLPGSGSSS
jgi:phosphoenolpyruvate carboxylase